MTQLLQQFGPRCFLQDQRFLISAPVLAAPNFSKPFVLTIDASDVGTRAVLMQEDEKGIDHPLGYFTYKPAKLLNK